MRFPLDGRQARQSSSARGQQDEGVHGGKPSCRDTPALVGAGIQPYCVCCCRGRGRGRGRGRVVVAVVVGVIVVVVVIVVMVVVVVAEMLEYGIMLN